MAISRPKPGNLAAVLAAAEEHGAALRSQPGCVGAYVLSERGANSQVSISLFTSEEAFRKALDATRPVIAKHHLEELLEADSSFHTYEVR